jgi:hypothetical protein
LTVHKWQKNLVLLFLIFCLEGVFSQQTNIQEPILPDIINPWGINSGQTEANILSDLKTFLEDERIKYETQEIIRDFNYHSFSQNLIVSFGNTNFPKRIIAVPILSENLYTNRVIPLVKNLLLHFKSYLGPELEFVFFSSEAYDQRGIQHYLRNQISSELAYVMYLSFEFISKDIDLVYGWSEGLSPAWLLQNFLDSPSARQLNLDANIAKTQSYLLKLIQDSQLEPFMAEDLASLGLVTRIDSLDPIEQRSLSQIEDLSALEHLEALIIEILERDLGILPQQGSFSSADTNYQTIEIGNAIFVINEQINLIFLLSILGICISWALIFRKRRLRYQRAIGKEIWHLPVFLILTALFLITGGLLIQAITAVRIFPNLWQYSPLVFLIIKISAAIFVFTFLYSLSKHLPFTRNGNFYSASAIMILFFDVLIFAGINITFTWYFIWALLWAFLFSLSRRAWLKIICFLFSPLWFIIALVQIFSSNQLGFIELLINSDIFSSFLIAFLLLPFLLLFIRLDLLIIHSQEGKGHIASRYFAITIASILVLMLLYGFLYNPYSNIRPQEITITEINDLESSRAWYQFNSESPLNDFELNYKEEQFNISTRNQTYRQSKENLVKMLGVSGSSRDFLNRQQYEINLEIPENTEFFRLRLTKTEQLSDADLGIVYYSNFPYSIAQANEPIEFYFGEWPAEFLNFEVTLEANQGYILEYELVSGKEEIPVSSLWDKRFFYSRNERGIIRLPEDIN